MSVSKSYAPLNMQSPYGNAIRADSSQKLWVKKYVLVTTKLVLRFCASFRLNDEIKKIDLNYVKRRVTTYTRDKICIRSTEIL